MIGVKDDKREPPQKPRMLDAATVAVALGVTENTVYRHYGKGTLGVPMFKQFGRLWCHPADLEAYFESKRQLGKKA